MKKVLTLLALTLFIKVNGQIPSTPVATNYYIMTYKSTVNTDNVLVIRTKIPYSSDHFPVIRIDGYNYENLGTIGLLLSWQGKEGELMNPTISSYGGITPEKVYLWLNEEGNIDIVMFTWGKEMLFSINAYGVEDPSWYADWDVLPDVSLNDEDPHCQVLFKNEFRDNVNVKGELAVDGSVTSSSLTTSTADISNLNVSNTTTTRNLQVIGGNILSNYDGWKTYGFYTAKFANYFTQNAYYDGTWRSYDYGGEYPYAVVVNTGGKYGNLFNIMADSTITAADQALSFYSVFNVSKKGNVIIGSGEPSATEKLVVDGSSLLKGRLMVGDVDPIKAQDYKLAVNGSALFTKAVVKVYSNWPDYVFESRYKLRPLRLLEDYVMKYKHLPGVPTAADIESNGLDVGETQAVLLKKIEELTLYVIDLNKRITVQEKEIKTLKRAKKH